MPNWCSNSLEVKGKRKDLIALKKKLTGEESCFTCENIIPRQTDHGGIHNSLGHPGDIIQKNLLGQTGSRSGDLF